MQNHVWNQTDAEPYVTKCRTRQNRTKPKCVVDAEMLGNVPYWRLVSWVTLQLPWREQSLLFLHSSSWELFKLLRTHKSIYGNPTKIHLSEVCEELLNWAIILKENTLGLEGIREQLPTCCAHLMYCLLTQQHYNLAYFFTRWITHLKGNKTKLIP